MVFRFTLGTLSFFSKLSAHVGEFICSDDNTSKKRSLDVARIKVRTRTTKTVNREFQVVINSIPFSTEVVEDWCGPLQWSNKESGNGAIVEGFTSSNDDFFESLFPGNGGEQGDDEVEEIH